MKKRIFLFALALVFALAAAGCVARTDPAETPDGTQQPAQTGRPAATASPAPSATARPEASAAPTPTATPAPTAAPTPSPTATPRPTAAPTPTPAPTHAPTPSPAQTETPVQTEAPAAAVNEFFNDTNYGYTEGEVSIRPRYVYWGEDGALYAECFVINGLDTAVSELDVTSLAFSMPDGTVIATAYFGPLTNLRLDPYSYATWWFTFPADLVTTPFASLSTLNCAYDVSYVY